MSKLVQMIASEPEEEIDYRRFERFATAVAQATRDSKYFWGWVLDQINLAEETKKQSDIEMAIRTLETALPSMQATDQTIAWCQAEEAYFEREELWEPKQPNDIARWISRAEVKRQILLLVDSFLLPANVPNLRAFLKSMIDEVSAYNPNPIVLEAACRKMRRTLKKVPTTAEVIEALKTTDKEWGDHWETTDKSGRTITDCFAPKLVDLRGWLRIAKGEDIPLMIFKGGERVRHPVHGLGVVEEPERLQRENVIFVTFDNNPNAGEFVPPNVLTLVEDEP